MLKRSPLVKIKSIEKVVNPYQARLHELEKEAMKRSHGNCSERVLWHGTGVNDPKTVALNSLDIRFSNQGYFASGIYLSTSPYFIHQGYGHENADGDTVMLLVKALVGKVYHAKMYNGTSGARPDMKLADGEICDSVSALHDNDNSDMAIVYKNQRCYVGYIVTYRE